MFHTTLQREWRKYSKSIYKLSGNGGVDYTLADGDSKGGRGQYSTLNGKEIGMGTKEPELATKRKHGKATTTRKQGGIKRKSIGDQRKIRQAFRPVACEILTDVLQILVPRLFVPLNLRVTLITLYQGPPTPGDSIPAASPRRMSRGATPGGRVSGPPRASFGPTCTPTGPIGPRLAPLWPPLVPIWAACGPHWALFGPRWPPFGPHLCPIGLIWGADKAQFEPQSSLLIMS